MTQYEKKIPYAGNVYLLSFIKAKTAIRDKHCQRVSKGPSIKNVGNVEGGGVKKSRRRVVKKCRHWGGGFRKSRKNADVFHKVIIDKSRGEVSLLEQDTIENVS